MLVHFGRGFNDFYVCKMVQNTIFFQLFINLVQRPWYVLSCVWDGAYKRTLAANLLWRLSVCLSVCLSVYIQPTSVGGPTGFPNYAFLVPASAPRLV